MRRKDGGKNQEEHTHTHTPYIDLILPFRYPLSRSILGGSFDEIYYGNEDDGRKTGPSAMKKKKKKIGTVGGEGEGRGKGDQGLLIHGVKYMKQRCR